MGQKSRVALGFGLVREGVYAGGMGRGRGLVPGAHVDVACWAAQERDAGCWVLVCRTDRKHEENRKKLEIYFCFMSSQPFQIFYL